MVSVGAVERNLLAGCQVRVPVVFVARGAEPGSAKCAFGHYLLPPRRLAISIGNTGYPVKIPAPRDNSQKLFFPDGMTPHSWRGLRPPSPPCAARAKPAALRRLRGGAIR